MLASVSVSGKRFVITDMIHCRHTSKLGLASKSVTHQMAAEVVLVVSDAIMGPGKVGCLYSLRRTDFYGFTHSDATNLSFTNLYGTSFRGAPFSISQCTTFSGTAGNCTSSKFELKDIAFANFDGTASSLKLASLQCSGVAPCHDITITNVTLTSNGESSPLDYLCGNVVDPIGWNCTGDACVGGSATGQC